MLSSVVIDYQQTVYRLARVKVAHYNGSPVGILTVVDLCSCFHVHHGYMIAQIAALVKRFFSWINEFFP